MNWEETIVYIRSKREYSELVQMAYLRENLKDNVEAFRSSDEYIETIKLIRKYHPGAKKILDIGGGNGISSVSFALDGYEVSVVEPDPSNTVGAGAIRQLASIYSIDNLSVYEAFAEDIAFEDEIFDIVYVRQAMHHAYDLNKFIQEAARVLRKGGLLVTIRDHVIFSEADKQLFLASHPLQQYYGGENAFTPKEYKAAMESAGLLVKKQLRFYDSLINCYPVSKKRFYFAKWFNALQESRFYNLVSKFLPKKLLNKMSAGADEMKVPGRMYSYIALKPS